MDLFRVPEFLVKPSELPDRGVTAVKSKNRPHVIHAGEQVQCLDHSPDGISTWLETVLHRLDAAAIYASCGDELNTVHRDLATSPLKICLVSATGYSMTIGNLGIPLIYRELLDRGDPSWLVDRCYLWDSRNDFKVFREAGAPLFGLQTHLSLDQFDVLLFSCSFVYSLLHVPLILKHSGIPHRWADRTTGNFPLIMVGGHQIYSNPEIIHHVPDLFFVGEFSAGALDVITRVAGLQEPNRSTEIVKMAREEIPGVYVPWLYDVQYSKYAPYPIISRTATVDGVPDRIRKAYVSNLDVGEFVTDAPIVPYIRQYMGVAEIQTSQGCPSGVCSFCHEGQTNKPYRFHSVGFIVRHLKQIMLNTGFDRVVLCAFDGAGHPQKNLLLKRIIEEVSDDAKLLSLRVDEMAEDPQFSELATLSGNYAMSLGVEGHSERMRSVLHKHCTEDQILSVVRQGLEAGSRTIKFFLISAHPYETEDDRMEWFETLKKVEAIRDELGAKTQIGTSWSPLVIFPWTPLQWEAPISELVGLNGLTERIKAETKTHLYLRGKSNPDSHIPQQLFTVADRRLSGVVDQLVAQDYVYYGRNRSGIADQLGTMVADVCRTDGTSYEFPLGLHTWFRAKPYSEMLPWDFLDLGVSKEWLIASNEMSKHGDQMPKCVDKCSQCGVCTNLDHALMDSGCHLPDPAVLPSDVKAIQQSGSVQVVRLRMSVDRSHRFVNDGYWPFVLRRAFYLAGLPVDKTRVSVVGQQYDFLQHTYGVEYADVGLMERVGPDEVVQRIRPFMHPGLSIMDARSYPVASPVFRRTAGSVQFKVLSGARLGRDHVSWAIDAFQKSPEFIVRILERGYLGRPSPVRVDIKPMVPQIWNDRDGNCHLMVLGDLNPYDIIPAVLKVVKSVALSLDVVRQEVYLFDRDSGQEDAFRPWCPVTGLRLPANLFDEIPDSGRHPMAYGDFS